MLCMVDRIKLLANEKGHSLTTLEKILGLGNGTIGKWKKQSPSCDNIKIIADYLQTSIDYLVTGIENKNTLKNDEIELLSYFNELDENQKARMLGRIEAFAELKVINIPPLKKRKISEVLKEEHETTGQLVAMGGDGVETIKHEKKPRKISEMIEE